MTDWSREVEQINKDKTQAPVKPDPGMWTDEIKQIALDKELKNNSGVNDDLRNFFKFAGHGAARGLMETIGFPVDIYNAAAYYTINHPQAMITAGNEGMALPGETQDIAEQAQKEVDTGKGPEFKPVYTGSTQSLRDVGSALGINTKTPKEEGVHSGFAEWGDTLGEFGGANLPFVFAAPEKIAVEGGSKVVSNLQRILSLEGKTKLGLDKRLAAGAHDVVLGAIAPGTGAAVGQEILGDEHKELGKTIGAVIGGLRFPLIEGGIHYSKKLGSFAHEALGLGTGAEGKVGRVLASSMQRPEKSLVNIKYKPEFSPGAALPLDIRSGDEGLIALRRAVMANDHVLGGQYHEMQNVTERAILADTKLNRANFATTQDWLEAKQKTFENLAQQRLRQAEQQAERDVATALDHAEVNPNNPVPANFARNAYALTMRNQLMFARDDLKAATDAKWVLVDKKVPVDTHSLYDELKTMKAEHKARPGQSEEQFPNKVVDRFFETKKDASGKSIEVPKFGPNTKLQDIIDLDSEVQQEIRTEIAKDVPNRVYTSYLSRLSKALNEAKGRVPGIAQNVPLQDALAATKYYHQTFSQGPVGQLLGLEETGATRVMPGDSIKHFISQGPGGVDSFNALVKAMQARSGKAHPMMPGMDMPTMLRNDLRQQFADASVANGVFNPSAARNWMQKNAGPLGHFEDLRKEFTAAIESRGNYAAVKNAIESRKPTDIDMVRAKMVDNFLGDPGKLFNGALEARDQYVKAKDLLKLTAEDPTGRATEGLVQKAFEHMWQTSKTGTKATVSLDRLDGLAVRNWVEKNKGLIRALDEAMPGIKSRFERISRTAEMLERFQVKPETAPETTFAAMAMNAASTVARIAGANIFSKFGERGGSIQTAAIGSQLFKQLAKSLTPDRVTKIFRRAMVEPEFFDALVAPITKANEAERFRVIQPYLYAMGIPLVQPDLQQSAPEPKQKAAR